jgi:hypothetical protein
MFAPAVRAASFAPLPVSPQHDQRMQLRSLSLAAAAAAALAVGPCRSPLNPAFETPCAKPLAASGAVTVVEVGAAQNVTLVETAELDTGIPLTSALYYGTSFVLSYFG